MFPSPLLPPPLLLPLSSLLSPVLSTPLFSPLPFSLSLRLSSPSSPLTLILPSLAWPIWQHTADNTARRPAGGGRRQSTPAGAARNHARRRAAAAGRQGRDQALLPERLCPRRGRPGGRGRVGSRGGPVHRRLILPSCLYTAVFASVPVHCHCLCPCACRLQSSLTCLHQPFAFPVALTPPFVLRRRQ